MPGHRLVALDPTTREWVAPTRPGAVRVPAFRGEFGCGEADLEWAAEDFGRLVRRRPLAVLRAADPADVALAVAFARAAGLTVAARGAGHSVYGQAQADGGLVIDTARLDRVVAVSDDRITVQAGARWTEVVDAALRRRRTPPVLTDHPDTSVGGTLSVGGVGGASHRHGLQADAVEELTVVTGTGATVTCSPDRERRLFDAALGGLGQCGVIVSATMRLVAAPTTVRHHRLRYRDRSGFVTDQRLLARHARFDFLQGHVVSGGPAGPRYVLEVASYRAAAGDTASVDDLGHDSVEQVLDLPYREFVHRMAPAVAAQRADGQWFHPHAWITFFVPDHEIGAAAAAAFDRGELGSPAGALVGLLFPIRATRSPVPMPDAADGGPVWVLSVLRGVPPGDGRRGAAAVEANRALRDELVGRGAKVYPINAVPSHPEFWRDHFGPRWAGLCQAKEDYDPDAILAPGQHVHPRPGMEAIGAARVPG
jgi:cytokinin dehydrogenase